MKTDDNNSDQSTPGDRSTHDLHKLDALEAILFASPEPLPLERIAQVLEVKQDKAFELIRDLTERLRGSGSLIPIETPDGFRLVTRPDFAVYIERLREPQRIRLSRPALETLAIVAYRQTITRAEIDHIRGVDSSATLQTLIDRALVEPVGRKEGPGRPVLYGTTPDFLEHFGLRDLSELPELPQAAIEEQARDLFDRESRVMAESKSAEPEDHEEEHSPADSVLVQPSDDADQPSGRGWLDAHRVGK